MSSPTGDDDDLSTSLETEKLSGDVLGNLVDSIIYDVASECHRMARVGVDWNVEVEEEEELRLCAEARARMAESGEVNGGKYVVDIFGQTHPAIANEIFECMNCGQSIMAGRFAPHLEKCMGKGRRAQQKARRSSRIAQKKNNCTTTTTTRRSPAAAASASTTTTTTSHITSSPNGGGIGLGVSSVGERDKRDMESSKDNILN